MLGKLAAGIAGRGHGGADPGAGARPTDAAARAPAGRARIVLLADPERIRTRAEDLVRTGQEFLAASWMAAATGGQAPIDLGESAYRPLDEILDGIGDLGLAAVADRAVRPATSPGSTAAADRGPRTPDGQPGVCPPRPTAARLPAAVTDAAERMAHGGATVVVVAGPGTAARAVEIARRGRASAP